MMNPNVLTPVIATLAMFAFSVNTAHAAVATEVSAAQSWTQVLEDFNDGIVNATISAPNDFSSNTEASGLGSFDVLGTATDPQIRVSQTGLFDPSVVDYYRMRFNQAAGASGPQIFPFPESAGTQVNFTSQTTIAEQSQAATIGLPTPNGNGIRIDPTFSNQAGTYQFDYVYADEHRIWGLGEWDETDGSGDLQGWTGGSLSAGPSVNGSTSSITGTAGSGSPLAQDAKLSLDVDDFSGTLWNAMEIRIQGSSSAGPVQLFWANEDGGFSEGRSVLLGSAGDVDGNWHIYQVKFAGDLDWIGKTITDLRIDPVSGVDNATFSIDYVRLVQFIPTPAALPAGLALIGLIATRRRR